MDRANIREMTIEDYDLVIALWKDSEGVGLSDADSREGVREYLERNPGISCVAEHADEIVGAVLGGHDGRRGSLHHLAVRKDHRRLGLGREMTEFCLSRLRAAGIAKCHIFVYNKNDDGEKFWNTVGWSGRHDLTVMSREIDAAWKQAR